ncbi:hypothetical protein AN641_01315 [Candidatus Epulonipiscioides gigas]|nr:hypothetical protein AN641_01315 [Epulopiscium sp. SCG-C07WGA-EpuloA2]
MSKIIIKKREIAATLIILGTVFGVLAPHMSYTSLAEENSKYVEQIELEEPEINLPELFEVESPVINIEPELGAEPDFFDPDDIEIPGIQIYEPQEIIIPDLPELETLDNILPEIPVFDIETNSNLISGLDPGFDIGTEGEFFKGLSLDWGTGAATIEIGDDNGNNVLELTNTGGSRSIKFTLTNLEPSTKYQLSLKAKKGTTNQSSAIVMNKNSVVGETSNVVKGINATASWEDIVFQFTTTETATSVAFGINFNSSSVTYDNAKIYIDDLKLVLADGVEPPVPDPYPGFNDQFNPENEKLDATPEFLPLSDSENIRKWSLSETFSDEFDATTLDTDKWDTLNKKWSGRFPSYYVAENVFVENGKLVLRANWGDMVLDKNGEVTTAGQMTQGYEAAVALNPIYTGYGYYEVKTRTAPISMTSSFWMRGDSKEIDVYEQVGRAKNNPKPDAYPINTHDFESGTDIADPFTYYTGEDLTLDYHVYGLEWGKDWLKFYYDGELIHVRENKVFNEPQEMKFDMEAFKWKGFPDKTDFTTFADPLTFEERFAGDFHIEYIRVWRSNEPQVEEEVVEPEIPAPKETSAIKGTPKDITSDGTIDVLWQEAVQISDFNLLFGGIEKLDATIKVKTMWDEDYLYILSEVKDKDVFINQTAHQNGDNIDIYLDGDNKKNTTYDTNDKMIKVMPDGTLSTSVTGVTLSSYKNNDGYTIQTKIPWSLVSVTPEIDKIIGFDIQLNEGHQDSQSREAFVAWNGDKFLYQDLSTSGNLKLIGENKNLLKDIDPAFDNGIEGAMFKGFVNGYGPAEVNKAIIQENGNNILELTHTGAVGSDKYTLTGLDTNTIYKLTFDAKKSSGSPSVMGIINGKTVTTGKDITVAITEDWQNLTLKFTTLNVPTDVVFACNFSDTNSTYENDKAYFDNFYLEKIGEAESSVVSYEYINEYFEELNTKTLTSSDNVEWVQFAPGNAGDSDGVFIHPTDDNTMFSFPDMGNAYMSGDGGKTWDTILNHDLTTNRHLTKVYGMDFSRQDENFGMASNNAGIQITTNKGVSFSDYVFEGNIEALAVHPNDDDIWFAGSGNFWNTKQNYRTDAKPHGISPAGNAGKLYKTTDSGDTWTELKNTGIHAKAEFGEIYIDAQNTELMFTSTTYGLYKSEDGGDTWDKITSIEKEDGGDTWDKITSIEKEDGDDHDLISDLEVYVDPSTGDLTLFVINQIQYQINESTESIESTGGILKSTDLGETWTDITGDLGIDLDALNKEIYTLVTETLDPNNIDYKGSENFISNWFFSSTSMHGYFDKAIKDVAPNFPTHFLHNYDHIEVDPTNPDKIYLSHDGKWSKSMYIGDVWTTDDGGKDWYIATRTGLAWEYPSEYWESQNQLQERNVQPDHYNYEFGIELYALSGIRDLDMNSKGDIFALYRTLYKSEDGGGYWQNLDSVQLPNGGWIGTGASNLPGKQIITDTRDTTLMYMVAGENRLFQKVDGDEEYYYSDTTAMVNYEHSPENISMIAIHPDDIDTMYAVMLRQTGQGEFYKSTDAGETWESISQIFQTSAIHTKVVQKGLIIDPNNPDNMYFAVTATNVNEVPPLHGTEYSGVYKSDDGGYNWTHITTGLSGTNDVFDLEFAPNNTNTIYAAASAGNAISILNPESISSWTVTSTGSGTAKAETNNDGYYSIVLKQDGVAIERALTDLLPNTEYYVSYYTNAETDQSATISVLSSSGTELGKVDVSNNTGLVKGVLFKTGDEETSVKLKLSKEEGEGEVSFDKLTLKTAGGLYRSTDNAQTWTVVPTFPNLPQVNNIVSTSDKIYVAAGNVTTGIENGGLWVGDANGENWKKIFEHPKVTDVKVDPLNEKRILVNVSNESSGYTTYNAGVYLSTDSGATWAKINKGIGNSIGVYDVAFDLDDSDILWLTSSSGGFYKGFIGGASERPTNLPTFDITFETYDNKTITEQVKKYSKVILPQTPTRTGYIFDGWYDGNNKYNFNIPVIEDITLTAKWIKNDEDIVDTTKPAIHYSGSKEISITQGASFTMPNITVTDDVTTNVTLNSVITNSAGTVINSINTSVVGTYKITYTATDEAGNLSSLEIIVKVKKKYIDDNNDDDDNDKEDDDNNDKDDHTDNDKDEIKEVFDINKFLIDNNMTMQDIENTKQKLNNLSIQNKIISQQILQQYLPYTSINTNLNFDALNQVLGNIYSKTELLSMVAAPDILLALNIDVNSLTQSTYIIPLNEIDFKDMTKDTGATEEINQAIKLGLISESFYKTFGSNTAIPLADALVLLDKVLLLNGTTHMELSRTQVEKYMIDKNYWAFKHMASIGSKLTEPTLKLIASMPPTGQISIELLAQLIYETTNGKIAPTTTAKISSNINSTYKDAINYCVQIGALTGTIEPFKNVTLAELTSILLKILKF